MREKKDGPLKFVENQYAGSSTISLSILTREIPDELPDNYRRVVIGTPEVMVSLIRTFSNLVNDKAKVTYPGLVRAAQKNATRSNDDRDGDAKALAENNAAIAVWTHLEDLEVAQKVHYWARDALTRQFLQDPEVIHDKKNPPQVTKPLMGAPSKDKASCYVLILPINFMHGARQHWVTLVYVHDEEHARLGGTTVHGFLLDTYLDYIPRDELLKAAYTIEAAFRLYGLINVESPPIQYAFLRVARQPDGFSCGYQFFKRAEALMNILISAKGAQELTLDFFAKAMKRVDKTSPSNTCNDQAKRMTLLAYAILTRVGINPDFDRKKQ